MSKIPLPNIMLHHMLSLGSAIGLRDLYRKGLNGRQPMTIKKYRGHRVIPETILKI